MTFTAQSFPFTFDAETGATVKKFSTLAAARRYADRMGRMDGRDAKACKLRDVHHGRDLATFAPAGRTSLGRFA